jgi:hemerythrin superfamily protein
MATSRRKASRSSARRASARKSTRRSSNRSARSGSRPAANDAIALLKADHRQVEKLFEEFEKTRSSDKKLKLARQICAALRMHTTIEEEIFYPAFLAASKDKDTHHEAVIEHDGAKKLIQQIEGSSPDDEWYDSKVKVLSEMIKHHVNEEEKGDGMFAEARSSRMDLQQLGQELAQRKQELTAEQPEMSATAA